MKQLALFVTRDSETVFYDLLAKNASIAVKELCRKVPRKMLYKYLKQLQQIQEATGMEIYERRAGICPVTGLPNIIIERKREIGLEHISDTSSIVMIR